MNILWVIQSKLSKIEVEIKMKCYLIELSFAGCISYILHSNILTLLYPIQEKLALKCSNLCYHLHYLVVALGPGAVPGDHSDPGHGHGRPHLIDHAAGVPTRVL